jgi:hypothetical protein
MLAGQSVNSEAELCSALRDLRARVAASPVVVDNAAAHSAAGYHVSTRVSRSSVHVQSPASARSALARAVPATMRVSASTCSMTCTRVKL